MSDFERSEAKRRKNLTRFRLMNSASLDTENEIDVTLVSSPVSDLALNLQVLSTGFVYSLLSITKICNIYFVVKNTLIFIQQRYRIQ